MTRSNETIEQRIYAALDREPWLSAVTIARRINQTAASTSSCLVKLVTAGRLVRRAGLGPRRGWGYALVSQAKPTSRLDLILRGHDDANPVY